MVALTQTLTDPAGLTDGALLLTKAGATTDDTGAVDVVSFVKTAVPLVWTLPESAGSTDGPAAVLAAGTTTDFVGATDSVTPTKIAGGLAQVITDRAGAYDSGNVFGIGQIFTDTTGARDVVVPPTIVSPPAATSLFSVLVDWARNGAFTDTGDDVTDRVRGPVTASYGRDQATSTSPVVVGRGGLSLDNTSRDYSPSNTGSPLFGKVKPSRPVLVQRGVAGTTYTLFRGHTDDGDLTPDIDSRLVGLTLIDYLADFRGVLVTTPLYQGVRTGAAIALVLDAVGWAGGRDLDVGATQIPWFWANGDDAFDLLQQLLASEGPPALLTVDETGGLVFRDRHHRVTRAASTTTQTTFAGDGAVEPVMTGLTYSTPWSAIVNDVSITVNERAPGGDLEVVWSTTDTIGLAANQARTVVVQASDPFLGAVAPVAGVDFTLTGAVTVAMSRTSGQSTSITLTAGASGATVTELRLQAFSVAVRRTYQVPSSDATSKADYGTRSLPSGSDPVWASTQDAQALADLWVATRKDPLPRLQARFVCSDLDSARLQQVLARDLSDRVAVTEAESTLSGSPFFVESIDHGVASVAEHAVTFGLEAVPAGGPSTPPFLVGTSVIGGSDPLAY